VTLLANLLSKSELKMNPESSVLSYSLEFGLVAVGFLVGVLVATAFFRPAVATVLIRIKSATMLSLGVGLLAWGIICMISGEPFARPFAYPNIIRSAIECVAWGSGMLTGGIVYLIIGYAGLFPRE